MVVVWLASYPRSGVTFLRHAIERVYGLPTWSLYVNEDAAHGGENHIWPVQADGSLPVYFVKTHRETDACVAGGAIHLIRDGRDVAISYAHYARTFLGDPRSQHTVLEEIVRGTGRYGHWGLHTCAWLSRAVPRILFDDLIANPIDTVCRAVEAVGCDLKPDRTASLDDFATLHRQQPRFYRQGTSGNWRNEMSAPLQAEFGAVHNAALRWFESQCEQRNKARVVVDAA